MMDAMQVAMSPREAAVAAAVAKAEAAAAAKAAATAQAAAAAAPGGLLPEGEVPGTSWCLYYDESGPQPLPYFHNLVT